jgi:hypothetical protein
MAILKNSQKILERYLIRCVKNHGSFNESSEIGNISLSFLINKSYSLDYPGKGGSTNIITPGLFASIAGI